MDVDAIEQRFVGAFPDTPEEEAILQLVAEIRRLRQFVADSGSTCYPCETCGHGRTTLECIWCERDRLRKLCGEAAEKLNGDGKCYPEYYLLAKRLRAASKGREQ